MRGKVKNAPSFDE